MQAEKFFRKSPLPIDICSGLWCLATQSGKKIYWHQSTPLYIRHHIRTITMKTYVFRFEDLDTRTQHHYYPWTSHATKPNASLSHSSYTFSSFLEYKTATLLPLLVNVQQESYFHTRNLVQLHFIPSPSCQNTQPLIDIQLCVIIDEQPHKLLPIHRLLFYQQRCEAVQDVDVRRHEWFGACVRSGH